MAYLIDTDVLSEFRKGPKANALVVVWLQSVESAALYLSVMTVGEIRMGVDRLARREPERAAHLDEWLRGLTRMFADRLVEVDQEIAEEWGRLQARRTVGVVDGLLAATARVRGLTLVTRNVSDYAGLGVDTLNPFQPR